MKTKLNELGSGARSLTYHSVDDASTDNVVPGPVSRPIDNATNLVSKPTSKVIRLKKKGKKLRALKSPLTPKKLFNKPALKGDNIYYSLDTDQNDQFTNQFESCPTVILLNLLKEVI